MQGFGSRRCRGSVLVVASLVAFLATPAQAETTPPKPVDGEFFYHLRFIRSLDRRPLLLIASSSRGTYRRNFTAALQPNSIYEIWIYERRRFKRPTDGKTILVGFDANRRVGTIRFQTGPDGQRLKIPPIALRTLVNAHDLDADGLPDVAEEIIGSDPENPDTDGDGLSDGFEADAGLDIIGTGSLARLGIVGSVDTPGTAVDVTVQNDLAIVADSGNGVICANVFNTLPPEIIARVDTPGTCVRVASTGALVAVADGPAGLQVIDITDPPAARIVQSVSSVVLGGHATCVAAVANLALVGLSTGVLVAVDMESGTILERVSVGGPLLDLVVAGDAIFAIDNNHLYTLRLLPGELSVAGSVASPVFAGGSSRVFAGGGMAYVTHTKGFNTFDVSSLTAPMLLQARNTAQFGWKHTVTNGSGLALAATAPNAAFDGPHNVSLFDMSSPTLPEVFLQEFETPGVARAVAIFNGQVFCADHLSGLHMINYLSPDVAGVAPTISLSTNSLRIDEAEEGQLLRITAAAQDDRQVRNVEFYVNGLRAFTDGSFPFEHFLVTPRRAVRDSIVVRARASDMAGNATWTDDLTIRLVLDSRAPRITRVVPPSGGVAGRLGAVAFFTSEPMDAATITPATFTLREAGPDGIRGNADDVTVLGAIEVRDEVLGVFLQVPSATGLRAGRYRARADGSIKDRAGNPLSVASTWDFVVYGTGGVDTDGDGVPDDIERLIGLDPNDSDTNNNGIPDGDEDRDLDGVSNAIEAILMTDLLSPDTDGDGIPDKDEDQDLDGLADAEEIRRGSSIFEVDSDRDGFPDGDDPDPTNPFVTPLRHLTTSSGVQNREDPQAPLGRVIVEITAENEGDPQGPLGRVIAPFSANNQGDPQGPLGRVLKTYGVRNDAAPEAVQGATQSAPTSVKNTEGGGEP